MSTPIQSTTNSPQRALEVPEDDGLGLSRTPPIDRIQLLEQCVGNLDFAHMMLSEFESTAQSCVDSLICALTERNFVKMASDAHAFRGVAGILAAMTLMELCAALESAAENSDWDTASTLIPQIQIEIQRTISFIPSIRTTT
jgi:HPt (histidine-containing phosphotransfer) domain-containing protein